MSPDKLSHKKFDGVFPVVGGEALAMVHPKVALAMGRIIGLGTVIDLHRTEVLGAMLAADFRAAAAIIGVVIGTRLRQDMVDEVARAELTGDALDRYEQVFGKFVKPVDKRRNDYAHKLWAVSMNLDCPHVMLVPVAESSREQATQIEADRISTAMSELNPDDAWAVEQNYQHVFEDQGIDLDKVLVLRLEDVIDDLIRADRARCAVHHLALTLRDPQAYAEVLNTLTDLLRDGPTPPRQSTSAKDQPPSTSP